MKDIFDLFDLTDIPEDLGDIKTDEVTKEFIELFRIAGRELSINELTVAYYRKYTVGQNRPKLQKFQVQNKIYKLSRDKNAPIASVDGKKGVYKLDYNKRNQTTDEEQAHENRSDVSVAPEKQTSCD